MIPAEDKHAIMYHLTGLHSEKHVFSDLHLHKQGCCSQLLGVGPWCHQRLEWHEMWVTVTNITPLKWWLKYPKKVYKSVADPLKIYFVCVYVCFACMCVCVPCVCSSKTFQKRCTRALGTGVTAVIDHHVGTGNQDWVLWKSSQCY